MKGNRFRVYINPLDTRGRYTSYREVTDDVELDSIGSIAQDLDNTEFDIGIYRISSFQITFRNDSGRYSDVGQARSIFRYTRNNALVKITWDGNLSPLKAGFFKAQGNVLSTETTLFIGLLDDSAVVMDLETQRLTFTLLGRESILNNVLVPDEDIFTLSLPDTVTMTIASPAVFTQVGHGLAVGNPVSFTTDGALPDGISANTPYYVTSVPTADTFTLSSSFNGKDVDTDGAQSGTHHLKVGFGALVFLLIYQLLNRSEITNLLTVDVANIHVGTEPQVILVDSNVELQGKTVWEAVSELLLLSNSVLYIDDNGAIIVSPRTASVAIKYAFYGQSSQAGAENIQKIDSIITGLSRVFNNLFWTPSYVISQNATSIAKYGAKSKEFTQTLFTDRDKQQAILDTVLAEFSLPKQEFDLYTELKASTLALGLLDKVTIDYPPMLLPGEHPFPICGIAICGQSVLPDAQWAFRVSPSDHYKIIGKEIDPNSCLIKFRMRLA